MKPVPTPLTAQNFGTSADCVEPGSTTLSAGYSPGNLLPAEHLNYYLRLLSQNGNTLDPFLTGIGTEINNFLVAAGYTPATGAPLTQLLSALQKGADSTVNADKVRGTTPGAWALAYLAFVTQAGWAAKALIDLKTVDGAGSGLDADTVDGVHLASILNEGGTIDCEVSPTHNTAWRVINTTAGTLYPYQYCVGLSVSSAAGGYTLHIMFALSNSSLYYQYTATTASITLAAWKKVWSDNNDGPGSGLDADTLDGSQAAAFTTRASETADKAYSAAPSTYPAGVSWLILNNGTANGWPCNIGSVITIYQSVTRVVQLIFDKASGPAWIRQGGVTNDTWAQWNLWNSGNDGSGSGLDADLVRATTPGAGGLAALAKAVTIWAADNDGSGSGLDADLVRATTPGAGGLAALAKAGTIWAADNDGAGSGLDADLLDGSHATDFAKRTAAAGPYLFIELLLERFVPQNSNLQIFNAIIQKTGAIRVYVMAKRSGSGSIGTISFRKNAVEFATISPTSTTYEYYYNDVTISPDDVITLVGITSSSTGNSIYVKNIGCGWDKEGLHYQLNL